MTRHISRSAALIALFLTWGLAAAPPAAAHETRVYYTLGVPTRDNTPAGQRLYAGLRPTGTPNRNGDPVVLGAGRTPGLDHSRQEWWGAWPEYPINKITGHADYDCDFAPFCKIEGQSSGEPTQTKIRFKLVNRYSGKCLAVQGGGAVAHDYAVIQWTCEEKARDQIWTIVVPGRFGTFGTYVVAPEPYANAHTCLGPAQRTTATAVRVFGGPGICPHWVWHPSLRDHRYPHTFVNPL